MPVKVTAFFEMGKWGWSEVYYNLVDIADAASVTRAQALMTARRNGLPSAAVHTATRISNPELRGSVRPLAGQGPGIATWSPTVDWAWSAILAREATQSTHINGRVFLRPGPETPGTTGVPDPSFIPPAVFLSLTPWRTELTFAAAQWVVRGLSTTRPRVDIVGGTLTGTSGTVTTFAAHGILAGELFRISGAPNPPGRCLNGLYRATSIPTTDSVAFTVPTGPNVTFGSGGYVRGQLYVYAQIQEVSLAKMVSRRTGRPFDQPRGRRSRRLVCCL